MKSRMAKFKIMYIPILNFPDMFSALNPIWNKKKFNFILCHSLSYFLKYTRKTNIVCNKKVQCKLIDYMIPKCVIILIIHENYLGAARIGSNFQ